MTLDQLIHYVEAGAVIAPLVGLVGHFLASLPFGWAKTVGNILNAVSVDFVDLANASKNAKASLAAKKEEPKP